MNTEQERKDFEAWYEKEFPYEPIPIRAAEGYFHRYDNKLWNAYQAGRAARQSQPMPPEISRDLLGKIVDEVFDGAIEDASVIEDVYRVVARECALQSQDEDLFSPTSLTGLSRDELIRQLQWALDYWMPAIASEDTPDGNRSARDARLLMGMKQPTGREEENTPAYWEKVKALQSQDREDAERYRWLRQQRTISDHACVTWNIGHDWVQMDGAELDAAIDHARRAEEEL